MKTYKITVFTLLCQQASALSHLYDALKQQSVKDFEWILVDDGAPNQVMELVTSWVREETDFEVIYMKVKNNGTHGAIHKGVNLARGELFFQLKADDLIASDAMEKICKWEATLQEESKEVAGFTFTGGRVKGQFIDLLSRQKTEVFYTYVLRQYEVDIKDVVSQCLADKRYEMKEIDEMLVNNDPVVVYEKLKQSYEARNMEACMDLILSSSCFDEVFQLELFFVKENLYLAEFVVVMVLNQVNGYPVQPEVEHYIYGHAYYGAQHYAQSLQHLAKISQSAWTPLTVYRIAKLLEMTEVPENAVIYWTLYDHLKGFLKGFNESYLAYLNEQEVTLDIKDGAKDWVVRLKHFVRGIDLDHFAVAKEFFNTRLMLKKQHQKTEHVAKVILICVVKNDLDKMKQLLAHHRKLGVELFAILDNGSTDGTWEWLGEQEDVDLFFTDELFITAKKQTWINRIISYYGVNRWYLVVDSDELFVYEDMEKKDIHQLIAYCETAGIKRVRALMVDMYADDAFYQGGHDQDYIARCKYFDSDSYEVIAHEKLDLVVGGPRHRLFNTKQWVSKYPLVFFESDMVYGNPHFYFPHGLNKNSKCLGALLHYKFLPSEMVRYSERAVEGNYANNGSDYKKYVQYLENGKKLSFWHEGSKTYVDSHSLADISLIDQIKW